MRALGLLVLILASGCLGAPIQAAIEQEIQSHMRIRSIALGGGQAMACGAFQINPDIDPKVGFPPPAPPPCIDASIRIVTYACTPFQAIEMVLKEYGAATDGRPLEMPKLAPDAQAPPNPEKRYVVCRFDYEWNVTARWIQPARLDVAVNDNGKNETRSCEVPLNGRCELDGAFQGLTEFGGPGEAVRQSYRVSASAPGVNPPTINLGSGSRAHVRLDALFQS